MKRQYYLRIKCTDKDCKEYSNYAYDTQREYALGYKRHNNKWTCVRHTSPNELLSMSNMKTEQVLTCIELFYSGDKTQSIGHYWQKSEDLGTDKCQSSFQYGNGYKAYADDFPIGTTL